MTTSKQKYKYHLSMAGEYLVAAQLQRLQIASSVTYGNAKQADVIAFHPDAEKVAVIEVKTTSKNSWLVGKRVPEPSNRVWVFVLLPENIEHSPEFYILTQEEIYNELKPKETTYFKKYKEKHGEEYGDKPGLFSITRKDVLKYQNNWESLLKVFDNKLAG